MGYKTFIQHLEKFGTLHPKIIDLLQEKSEEIIVKDGVHILEPGNICRFIYFIKEGLFRTYKLFNGKSETTDFTGPNEFMTDLSSFCSKKESKEGLVCERTASVIRFNAEDWHSICEQDVDFMKISMNVSTDYMIRHQKRSYIYCNGNTLEKLTNLCSVYPDLLNNISHKNISGFFGVSEQYLNRIIINIS